MYILLLHFKRIKCTYFKDIKVYILAYVNNLFKYHTPHVLEVNFLQFIRNCLWKLTELQIESSRCICCMLALFVSIYFRALTASAFMVPNFSLIFVSCFWYFWKILPEWKTEISHSEFTHQRIVKDLYLSTFFYQCMFYICIYFVVHCSVLQTGTICAGWDHTSE